ncbi:unnamed protein product [Camellia sinensis]
MLSVHVEGLTARAVMFRSCGSVSHSSKQNAFPCFGSCSACVELAAA